MSDGSKIEWTDASWNPVTGCTKVSDGCKHCYAERDWARLAAPRSKPNIYTGRDFTDVRCHPEKLDIPPRWTKPRRIFVNSMSDLFHEDVPHEFIASVFVTMMLSQQHIFQILTKRPKRMLESVQKCGFAAERMNITWPLPNVWLGVSCEDQATADERIPLLLQTPAAVHFISAEPLLEQIIIAQYFRHRFAETKKTYAIDWVIAGGESGPRARPSHPVWFRSLRNQCQAGGVPFFFKQWGEWLGYADCRGSVCGLRVYEAENVRMYRVGKKSAGRTLDGRTWDEYPA